MKATWQGYVALGQLGIPIRLYTASQLIQPKFVQLHILDGSPVRRVLECKAEGQPIPFDEVIRGVEYAPGQYIPLTERELDQVSSLPARTVAIQQFCDADAVEPQYYDKPYYVVPSRGGERAYALLREVFARTRKMAIAQVIVRGKQYVAVLRVTGDVLMLLLLRYAGQLVPRSSIKTPPLSKPSPEEVEALRAVVERFGGPFYIADYHDERAEFIRELVERKTKSLPPRRAERVKPYATPEDEIVPALRSTLDGQRMLLGGEPDGKQ